MSFFVERTNPPTAFFCLCLFASVRRDQKSCFFAQNFLPKIAQKFSLDLSYNNTKGDIFLSRARINTHAEESCSRFIIAVVV
jgi:hypothetical protein